MSHLTTSRLVYLWDKGTQLRDKHPTDWWLGYKVARAGQEDVVPKHMNLSDDEIKAFHSGYEYRKAVYDDGK
jgi:hypothetical protein